MALAVLIFSFMAALAKYAAETVPSAEVVFFRSAINLFLILCIHYCKKKRGPLLGKNRKNRVRDLFLILTTGSPENRL